VRAGSEWVMVWDLETVPDLSAAARLAGELNATDEQIRAAVGSGFPKLPLHEIVCIGALIANRVTEGWQITALGAPHKGERSEAELIEAFVQRIAQITPRLVTYNGNSFDLPVLRYRAMVNRIPAPGLYMRPYFQRYTDDAVDLCDVLSSFDGRGRVKLDELSKVLGLPGKPSEIDGSRVEEFVNAGRIAEVALYCESDVLNTYRIWLIYELIKGSITREQLSWSEVQLQKFIGARKVPNPYL
jgi:predicted PolB exonuclease-like 3'-5' exonuclease